MSGHIKSYYEGDVVKHDECEHPVSGYERHTEDDGRKFIYCPVGGCDGRYQILRRVLESDQFVVPNFSIGPEMMGMDNYEGYLSTTGGRSAITGDKLPPWGAQSDIIRKAWTQGAQRVLARYGLDYLQSVVIPMMRKDEDA